MAFITTPAFSLYNGSLFSISKQTNETEQPASKRKVIDPFDPEASVPLPYQLDEQPYSTSVWKRNERERYRVRCVNNGYETLRKHLPVSDVDKRISKVDTLRLAIRYIKHLEALLKNEDHIFKCQCFHGFVEESEGHVQIDINVRDISQKSVENRTDY
ncbi:Helix-loop-helix DNA-binding domain protein [Dictyocaulus viviparus]|uniref:Helix-loop-helix DNA-binding domain protein n=1 Tax=Dictyocaulus viviparus TaxID=29172 RepID=A0A0D8Y1Y3_DICVI|nr:Helix-loop-helix DNA-binding domain protein [Dictyocaulus viviparus]